jgi:predicted nuclease of predicted toxin-antitoxin system
MRVLLDECVPKPVLKWLTGHDARTTQEMGWKSKKNGELLALAENHFDVFLTADRNLSYQQNLSHRKIAIVLLPTNRLPIISRHIKEITNAVASVAPNGFMRIKFED